MSIYLDAFLRSSLVLVAGFGALWLMRRQPAAFRHWILVAALALAAAQPAINRAVPALQIPLTVWAAAEAEASPRVDTTISFEIGDPHRADPAPVIGWSRVAVVLWAVGMAISLAILLAGASWLVWLGARAEAAAEHWQHEAEQLRAALGIVRPVRVLQTRHPALLVTWGTLSPVILLPEGAASWPADRVRLVMAHELAHLARRDWLIQLAAQIVCAINWFNPLFWIACARLRRESEYACDDIVLDLGVGGTSYASHLLDLARSFSVHGRTWLPAPSIARPSTLERRVRAMLNPQLDRRPVSRLRRAALAFILLAVAVPIAAATQPAGIPSGKVSDPSGRPLANADLRMTAASGQLYEARTDDTGNFEFPQVPAGDYLLSVRYPGFSSRRQLLRLTGGDVTLALQVQVGTLRETVTVGGGTPDGNGGNNQVAPPPPPICTPTPTGGQLIPPMKVSDVRPIYRKELIDAKVEGSVLLQARIGTDGKVRNVDVISPVNADLEDAAFAAVSQWEFTPTYLNCDPVEVQMYVTVSFKADR